MEGHATLVGDGLYMTAKTTEELAPGAWGVSFTVQPGMGSLSCKMVQRRRMSWQRF
jgi:hypothetical protein